MYVSVRPIVHTIWWVSQYRLSAIEVQLKLNFCKGGEDTEALHQITVNAFCII